MDAPFDRLRAHFDRLRAHLSASMREVIGSDSHVLMDLGSSRLWITGCDGIDDHLVPSDVHISDGPFCAGEHDRHPDGTFKRFPGVQQGVIAGKSAEGAVEVEVGLDPSFEIHISSSLAHRVEQTAQLSDWLGPVGPLG
jgi:hypothetical protein